MVQKYYSWAFSPLAPSNLLGEKASENITPKTISLRGDEFLCSNIVVPKQLVSPAVVIL